MQISMNVRMMTQGTQGQGTSWMETALIALVLLSLVSMISFAQLLHDLLCSIQSSMTAIVMT